MRQPGGGDRSDDSVSSEQRAEADLVARLQAYDEAAIRQVYRLYADSIYRYAFYQCGDPELAEDVAGEVFVRMMESIGSYTYRGWPISAWLYRSARNLIIDHQRRRNRLKPLDETDESSLMSDNPIDVAELQLTANELHATLNELTDEQRQVIALKFLEDLDNRSIAEVIGKSEGSVKSLQHRALRSLRRLLEKQGSYAGRS